MLALASALRRLNLWCDPAPGLHQPLSCRARCGGLDTQSNEKRREDREHVMNTVDRRTILTTGAWGRAGAATQSVAAKAQPARKPIFPVPATTIPIVGETDVFQ